jgi:hypothetical protein
MHTINNLPYLDLSDQVDLQGLELVEKDIILGIVKSREFISEGCANTINCYNKSIPSILESKSQITNPDNPNYSYYKELNFVVRDCLMFNRYADYYQQMGQVLFLRNTDDTKAQALWDKDYIEGCFDKPAYENFPLLKQWIENCKIFDKIGRILFFFNSPKEPHSIHKDSWTGQNPNFILINLNPDRKDVFVYDETAKKHIITSKVSVFDVRNFHGSAGKDFYSWTLRIDGIYNKEWAESIGIWEHFKPIGP